MAQLDLTRRQWWSHLPGVDDAGSQHSQLRENSPRLRVDRRAPGDPAVAELLRLAGGSQGRNNLPEDHLLVATGNEIVDIHADRLDLSGVAPGDDVTFSLSSTVDPGGLLSITGKVIASVSGKGNRAAASLTAGGPGQPQTPGHWKLDVEDPVASVVEARANLFREFRQGRMDQGHLAAAWDKVRTEAVNRIVVSPLSAVVKRSALQQLFEMGVFTLGEAAAWGIKVSGNPGH